MRFALLGDDAQSLRMAETVARDSSHQLTAAYESRWAAGLVQTDIAAGVQIARRDAAVDAWESLLSGAVADAVIVAGAGGLSGADKQRRDDQLRKLVQAGLSLLVVHPACEAIIGFELDMIRRDTGAVIAAFGPGIGHPAIDRLASWIESPMESPIGNPRQLLVERTVADNESRSAWNQLARDATAVRRIAGSITKVFALGALPPNAPTVDLAVGLDTQKIPSVRWTLSGGMPPDKCKSQLFLIGNGGQATLHLAEAADHCTLVVEAEDAQTTTFTEYDETKSQLEGFVRAIEDRRPSPAWIDVCRDLDVAEMAERSWSRGRGFELYQDEPTEAGTFKGVMAAGGCFLLLLSLLVLLIAGVVEGLNLPFRNHLLWRIWPAYLVAPLILFLLLQTLNFVARPSSSAAPTGDSDAD